MEQDDEYGSRVVEDNMHACPAHQVMSRKQHESDSIFKLRTIMLVFKVMVCANAFFITYSHLCVFLVFLFSLMLWIGYLVLLPRWID